MPDGKRANSQGSHKARKMSKSVPLLGQTAGVGPWEEAVEKSRQQRSRHFSVLTYWKYALRAKMTVALLDELF